MSVASVVSTKGVSRRGSRSKKRSSAQFATVARPRLMQTATEYLARDGFVALCSERGMGRHVLAAELAAQHRSLDGKVNSIRLSETSPESSCRRLKRCVTQSVSAASEGELVLIVAEGLSCVDDIFAVRMAHCFVNAVQGGCKVLVIASPEAETVLDYIPGCRVIRARELALDEEEYFAWGNLSAGYPPELVTRATHGIPALVAALKNTTPTTAGTPAGPVWERTVDSLMADALRPSLIKEEQTLRCAMAALGSGEIQELEEIGVRVSRDLLEETALAAPIFGANAQAGSFGLVPCGAGAIARTISRSFEGSDELVSKAIYSLASRGNVARAAALASSLEDSSVINSLACAYPLEFIDNGLANVVVQALGAFNQDAHSAEVAEVLFLSGVLKTFEKEETRAPFGKINESAKGRGKANLAPKKKQEINLDINACPQNDFALQLELLRAHHELLSHNSVSLTEAFAVIEQLCAQAEKASNVVTRKLACHVRVLANICACNYTEAFRELMISAELIEQAADAPSIFSAILQFDFDAVRALLGDPEYSAGADEHSLAEAVLAYGAPSFIKAPLWGWYDIVQALVNTDVLLPDLSKLIAFHTKRNEYRAAALANIFAAFIDVAQASYRKAHIHAAEARKCALLAADADKIALAGFAEFVVLSALGEDLPHSFFEEWGIPASLGQVSPEVGALIRLYTAFVMKQKADQDQAKEIGISMATLRLELQRANVGIAALATFVTRSDAVWGSAFARELPLAWFSKAKAQKNSDEHVPVVPLQHSGLKKKAVSKQDTMALARGQKQQSASYAVSSWGAMTLSGGGARIKPVLEIRVMGKFATSVYGHTVSDEKWRRAQAKIILAYLALKPSHQASRLEITELLWPEADYRRGRDGLYSALSALRSALGQTNDSVEFIISELGQLRINELLVSCDVDRFLALTKGILATDAVDDEIVSRCMLLESLYAEGSFIPANDPRGFFKKRHGELKEKYCEALLCGIEAARRLGDERQAKWFSAARNKLV